MYGLGRVEQMIMDESALYREIKLICEELESKGENSIFLSIKPSAKTASYHGSILGTEFLLKRLNIVEEFYKFCENESVTAVVNRSDNEFNCIKLSTEDKQREKDNKGSKNVKNKIKTKKHDSHVKTETVKSIIVDNMHNYSVESVQTSRTDGEKFVGNHLRTGAFKNVTGNHLQTVDNASNERDNNKETLGGSPKINIGNGEYECVTQSFSDKNDNCLRTFHTDNAFTKNLQIEQNEKTSETKFDQNKTSVEDWKDITNNKLNVNKDEIKDPRLNDNKVDLADSIQQNKCVDKNINMNNSVSSDGLEENGVSKMDLGKGNQEEHSGGKYSLRKRKTNTVQVLMNKKDKKSRLSDKKKDEILSSKSTSPEKLFKMKKKTEEFEPDQNITYCHNCAQTQSECKCQKQLKQSEAKIFVTCAECNQGFSNLSKLRGHLCYIHNKMNLFRCPNCHEAIPSQAKLKSHYTKCKDQILSQDSDEDGYHCSLCFDDFQSEDELQTHLKLHKPDTSLVCDICKKVFESNYKLRKHKIKHSVRGLPYKCIKCPKVFSTSNLLKSHLRTYHKIKNYVCNICSSLFPSLEIVTEHRKTHNENTCKKCSKIFKDKDEFTKHIKTHDTLKEEGHRCEDCGKMFEEMKNLKLHMQTHKDVFPYSCDQCGSKFKRKDTLRKHKNRTHSKKRFMCDMCGKLYNCTETLDQHKRKIHAEKKITYSCSHCERKFGTLAGHHQHILDVHCTPENVSERTNFKVHKCQYCTKMFATKHVWEYHMNAHLGKKPFTCNICPAAYSSKSDLRIHRLIHEERKHKCIICNCGFINISKYKVHLTSQKHKLNMEKASSRDNNNAKTAITEKDIVDEKREKKILGKKTYKTLTTSNVTNDRVKNGQINEKFVNSEEFCNEIQIPSEINQEGEISQIESGTAISVIDSGNELMEVDNSVLVVVTNDQENGVVGDYILQEYNVADEAVHTIITREHLLSM